MRTALPPDLQERLATRLARAGEEDVLGRLLGRDPTLWGDASTPELADRLGWVDIAQRLRGEADELTAWAKGLGAEQVLLLGMGGSSLAPEVLRTAFAAPGLRVLDSTDAAAVRAADAWLDLGRAIVVVSSKSGGTVETLSHLAHFWERAGGRGERFVAVTDPGSPLEALAQERGFARAFANDPEIGGRYSALSYFGLVPAALAGIDPAPLLDGAIGADPQEGLELGCAMGELALAGRDKLTLVVGEPLGRLGLWVEQLVAESTGKHGRGTLPVADEPLGAPDVYGDDRLFVGVGAGRDLPGPSVHLDAAGPQDLGRLFYVFEVATAVAGWVLGINPFDQPDVQEAKDSTRRVLEEGATAEDGRLADVLGGLAAPDYLALLGYLAPSEEVDAAVGELRAAIRDRTGATTTFGYGPRYLHSTGQYHKGGPPQGRFVELVHSDPTHPDLPVPGRPYTFDGLKAAQATGDLSTLRSRGRPACRVVLEGDPATAIRALQEAL